MKRTTITTLVANLRWAIARCLDRIFVRATHTDSQSRGTSRIDDGATTVALCPDVTGVWSLAVLLIGSLFAATSLPAAEQDNWYLADEWNIPTFNVYQDMGVAYFFDDEVDVLKCFDVSKVLGEVLCVNELGLHIQRSPRPSK